MLKCKALMECHSGRGSCSRHESSAACSGSQNPLSISTRWKGRSIRCRLSGSENGRFASIRTRFPPISVVARGIAQVLALGHSTELCGPTERGDTHWLGKRFQTGTVRLRTDRGPAYWQGRYWADIVDEAGRTIRKRV